VTYSLAIDRASASAARLNTAHVSAFTAHPSGYAPRQQPHAHCLHAAAVTPRLVAALDVVCSLHACRYAAATDKRCWLVSGDGAGVGCASVPLCRARTSRACITVNVSAALDVDSDTSTRCTRHSGTAHPTPRRHHLTQPAPALVRRCGIPARSEHTRTPSHGCVCSYVRKIRCERVCAVVCERVRCGCM